MEVIGIIAEYNPFHNGHKYHLNTIKKKYPDSLLILVLNGYFIQRGGVSVLTKEDKIKIALENNIDLVIEHPFLVSSQSADTYAESAIHILNYLKCDKLIFGSESNNIKLLINSAETLLNKDIDNKIKESLNEGISYPKAISLTTGINLKAPNDILGISYIKAILKNNYKIKPETIKRTNDYHDLKSNKEVISASNIRNKFYDNIDIKNFTNYSKYLKKRNDQVLFALIKHKIITEDNLNKYLSVDEGLDFKLKKVISKANNLEELIDLTKSKRYTYNRIKRMLTHILIGIKKENKQTFEYIKVLGFNKKGSKYLNEIKKDNNILIDRKISSDYLAESYELKASMIYDLITNEKTYDFEKNNKPIIKKI